MNKTRANIHTIDLRARIFWSGISVLVALITLYGFLLNSTIASVVFIEENQKSISDIRSDLSTLEEQYLALSSSITIEKAHEIGLIDDKSPSYVKVPTLKTELSLEKVQN